jgi:hypothetical protein
MALSSSTPDRLNVYPRAPRDDPNPHRPLVDPTIRGVRFEEPRRQLKQHPRPRTEATSSSVVSRNHSFRQHNLRKNAAVTPPELTCDAIDFAADSRADRDAARKAYVVADAPWTLRRRLWCTPTYAIGWPFFEPMYRRLLDKTAMLLPTKMCSGLHTARFVFHHVTAVTPQNASLRPFSARVCTLARDVL